MLVSDESPQQLEIPLTILRDCKEQLGAQSAISDNGDAPVGGLQHLAGIPQDVAEGLLRPLHALQMSGQPVEELERLEFPCRRQHRGTPDQKAFCKRNSKNISAKAWLEGRSENQRFLFTTKNEEHEDSWEPS
jgi:hypothetical protein